MKVTMKTSMAGPRWSAKPGDVVEFSDSEADRLIERGMAEEFHGDEPSEVLQAPAKTVKNGQSSSGGGRKKKSDDKG